MKIRQKPAERIWAHFQEQEKLSDLQLEQFKKYAAFLFQKNEEFNLTAILDLGGVVRQHFQDSLALSQFADLSKKQVIVDIGSGAGFPGIPLKIMHPEIVLILLEVKHKKKEFLEDVINLLELDDVYVNGHDWRTFLRITEEPVGMFVTKAALVDVELCRAFKPACRLKHVPIVYWASADWEPNPKAAPFVRKIEGYKLGKKNRKLVFLGLDNKVKE